MSDWPDTHEGRMAYIESLMRQSREASDTIRRLSPGAPESNYRKPALWRRIVRAVTDWVRGEHVFTL